MRQRPHEHLEGGWVSHCTTQHFILGLQSEKAGTEQKAAPAVLGPSQDWGWGGCLG